MSVLVLSDKNYLVPFTNWPPWIVKSSSPIAKSGPPTFWCVLNSNYSKMSVPILCGTSLEGAGRITGPHPEADHRRGLA